MSETHDIGTKDERPPSLRGTSAEGLDQDILPDRILGFAGGVVGLIVFAAVACWLLFAWYGRESRRQDPAPPALPEARARVLPPEPRLQVSPTLDMRAYRAREEALLRGYGWADQEAATARIPIDRAIDLYVTTGARAALAERPGGDVPESGPGDGGAP